MVVVLSELRVQQATRGRAVIGGTGNHGRSVVDILAQGAPIPSRSYIELFLMKWNSDIYDNSLRVNWIKKTILFVFEIKPLVGSAYFCPNNSV